MQIRGGAYEGRADRWEGRSRRPRNGDRAGGDGGPIG